MNGTAIGANTSIFGNACCRAESLWSRLRLGSLIPVVLGACMLLPAFPSALQAKEIFMQDNQGQYQPYTPGMKLPEGVFPPMQGYTHEDLIEAAGKRVEAVLKANDVDSTQAKETLFALADHLNRAFQSQNVEYQIATWFKKPYDDPAARAQSVSDMGESFGALAIRAAGDTLKGSPLLHKSDAFLSAFINGAGDGVHDLIVTLNKPSA
ncbi:hypothetical protein [Pseudomonas oryzicola]|uniref:Uncharacterized protein n=1 Tax=Pseudomonas oryzicola TaxID=485876 RepID=A0ABS6Q4D5_9PSED|nr:hypothetical protein [Pseudomonas oryzicola]MBV4489052.1 hypothetical protein [Pseudomonas oryzicola]